jgi:hypothetical protein
VIPGAASAASICQAPAARPPSLLRDRLPAGDRPQLERPGHFSHQGGGGGAGGLGGRGGGGFGLVAMRLDATTPIASGHRDHHIALPAPRSGPPVERGGAGRKGPGGWTGPVGSARRSSLSIWLLCRNGKRHLPRAAAPFPCNPHCDRPRRGQRTRGLAGEISVEKRRQH